MSFAGLHQITIKELQTDLKVFAIILQQELQSHPEKTVIVRGTLPQHFSGHGIFPDGYYIQDLAAKVKKKKCITHSNYEDHWTNFYLKTFSKTNGYAYLDSPSIYADRWDLHKQMPGPKVDCTHFCHTPETLVAELVLLNDILKNYQS